MAAGKNRRVDVRSGVNYCIKILKGRENTTKGVWWRGTVLVRTVLLDVAGRYCAALLVLPELLYTPGCVQRRAAGSREEARSSGEVLCSCGGRMTRCCTFEPYSSLQRI